MITSSSQGAILSVKVVPRASRTELVGPHGDSMKIRLQAPPVDGKANKELCSFLADRFQLSRNDVQVISGLTSRAKRVLLRGVSAETAEQGMRCDPN